MLEEIKKKVQAKLNNSREIIIMGMYQKMISAHNDFCGCDYCMLLNEYVRLKKYKSCLSRRMNDYDYDYMEGVNTIRDLNEISDVKRRIRDMKDIKDRLKVVCFINK